MPESVREKVREVVLRHNDGVPVGDDEDLFDGGYVNSLFVVQLVAWIEREYDVRLALNELVLDDLRTITAIAGVIETSPAGEETWTSV
ncbi:acyl carrier protein [Plantactinospora sp. GCM10030261]|uniref:acyl carrier protein n=1 Tax=Plantactinospora sp. GCM10030261 TaxID=3273420 RepID=UPI00361798C9